MGLCRRHDVHGVGPVYHCEFRTWLDPERAAQDRTDFSLARVQSYVIPTADPEQG